MPKTKTPEQRAAEAADELRALIRAAHEAAQNLTEASKAARAQVDDYLHDGVQQALDQYTGMMQENINRAMKILDVSATNALQHLRAQLQAVADCHSLLFITLAHGLALSVDPPDSTLEARRQAIIDSGNLMVKVYRQVGIKIADESLPGELLDRVRLLTRPNPVTMMQLWAQLDDEQDTQGR